MKPDVHSFSHGGICRPMVAFMSSPGRITRAAERNAYGHSARCIYSSQIPDSGDSPCRDPRPRYAFSDHGATNNNGPRASSNPNIEDHSLEADSYLLPEFHKPGIA